MKIEKDFSNKALTEIKLWVWLAAILPITGLSGVFFLWIFGCNNLINILMVVGSTTMFGFAAVWWWWIIYTIARILKQEKTAMETLSNTVTGIREIRSLVKETFKKDK